MTPEAAKMLAAGLAIGLGAIGPGIGIGILGYGAMQGLARNPEARGPIMTNMIIAVAMAEAATAPCKAWPATRKPAALS